VIPLSVVVAYIGFTVYAIFKPPARKWVAISLAFIVGLFMMLQFFATTETPSGKYFNDWYQRFNSWAIIVGGLTVILAVGNILRLHIQRVRKLQPGWGYSVLTLAALFMMSIFGLISIEEIRPGLPWYMVAFKWMWYYFYVPLDSTMFALLAFFMASAAYRAFRARNVEATLMLATAILVMLGRVPIGAAISPLIPRVTDWLLNIPNMAAQRGIMMGIALGIVATSLKIILGIERPYLGGVK